MRSGPLIKRWMRNTVNRSEERRAAAPFSSVRTRSFPGSASTPPMEPHAFRHLPELQGRLTPPQASGLRLTDEVLAAWDAQARQQGLSADWRLPDDVVERSRQAVLAQSEGCDLWVFAYGSLMWNPAIHFDEVRRARLADHARRFALATTIGRGTPDSPGLVLTLQRGVGDCEGLAFRIPQALLERESRMLWRREMIHGSYCPGFQPLHTPQGGVRALVLSANTAHPLHRGGLSLDDTAAIIASAQGSVGSNRDYLDQLACQLDLLGIRDDYVRCLAARVRTHRAAQDRGG